jgi:hypothetical protein
VLSLRCSTLLLLVALAGCSTVKVKTEFDPTAQFTTYKTYAWLATAPGSEQAPTMQNPALRQRVVAVLDREMARKGLVRTSADASPDFLVSVIGCSQNRVALDDYGYAYSGTYTYGPYGPGAMSVPVPVEQVRQYTEGTLLLDFVDAKSRKMFWRGTATDTLSSPEDVQSKIDDAARQLLAAYPPRPQ